MTDGTIAGEYKRLAEEALAENAALKAQLGKAMKVIRGHECFLGTFQDRAECYYCRALDEMGV